MPHSILTLSYLSSGSNSTALPGSDVGLTISVTAVTMVIVTVVMVTVTFAYGRLRFKFGTRRIGWCICMSCTCNYRSCSVVIDDNDKLP